MQKISPARSLDIQTVDPYQEKDQSGKDEDLMRAIIRAAPPPGGVVEAARWTV